MNTQQNYVGGGDSATPNPRKAQNGAESPNPFDSWHKDFLLKVAKDANKSRDLIILLDRVKNHLDLWNAIPGLCDLLESYFNHRTPEADVKQVDLSAVVSTIKFLTQLREDYTCFDTLSDYTSVSTLNEAMGGASHE